jgi:hypothetical protein
MSYVLGSAAFALSLVLLVGILLLNPIETALFWGRSALGTINITMYLTVIAAYLAYLLRPRLTKQIKEFTDILLFASIFSALITAIFTSGSNQESWFLALNWFIVNHGYMFGLIIGLSIASIMGTFQIFTASYGRAYLKEKGGKPNVFALAAFIAFFAVFAIGFLFVWRYGSHIALLSLIFVCALVFAVFAFVFWLSRSPSFLNSHAAERFASFAPKTEGEVSELYAKQYGGKRLSAASSRIFGRAGYAPSKKDLRALRAAVFFLILFAAVGVYGLIDKTEILFFPGAPVPGTVRRFQIAAIAAALIFLVALMLGSKSELGGVRKNILTEKGVKSVFNGYPFLHCIKSVFEIFALAMSVYYFCIVIYLPDMLMKELAFAILGAAVYFIVVRRAKKSGKGDRSDIAAKGVYLFAFLIFVVCVALLLDDNLKNGVANDERLVLPQDNFPFKFIHSIWHTAMMGIVIGVLLADKIYYGFARAESFSTRSGRAAGISFAVFVIGLITVGFGHAIVLLNGAGDWPPTYGFKVFDIPFGKFFTVAFGLMFVAAVVIELLSGIAILKTPRSAVGVAAASNAPPLKPLLSASAKPKAVAKRRPAARAAAALIAAALIVSSVPLASFFVTSELSREIVAEGDGYYIWTTDSYEKVMPQAYISKKGSKRVDAASISVAKNEYGSLQFIWRTETDVENLNATVTISEKGGSAVISDAALRLAENLYVDTYPEILAPIDGQTIKKGENTSVWFSFFTDYYQQAGDYLAELDFSFVTDGKPGNQKVYVNIEVAPYALPKNSHYFFVLPWDETDFTNGFYAKYRQFQNGGKLIDGLANRSLWYDGVSGSWDYTRPLSQSVIDSTYKNWGIVVATGMDLWNAWADIAVAELNAGRPAIMLDYLTVIASVDGIRNPANWTGETWNGSAWEAEGEQTIYSYYYFLNEFLLSKQVNAQETLADRTLLKWKDEWDQPQFFPSSPTGRTLGRKETYEIYKLELSVMNRARDAAVTAAGASGGLSYLANVNPVAENMEILFDYFDIYCPLSYTITDELVSYCHERGKTVWLYTCVQPFLPYANQFGYNQLMDTHITQWQLYQTRTEGYWLWKSDLDENTNFFYGFNGYLDGIFIYYENGEKPDTITAGSFMTGIRFETATESIEEVEYFIMLENILVDLKKNGNLSAKDADALIKELQKRVSSCVKSVSDWTKNQKKMRQTIEWTRTTIGSLYSQHYASRPGYFSDVVEGKWNTAVNPLD